MADHTNKVEHVDAQDISFEHGKSMEVLRQAKSDHWEPSSAVAGVTSNHHVLDCEVDIYIRSLRVMTVDVPDANADLTINRNRAGTLTALATATAVDTLTTEIFANVTLTATVGPQALRKNDSVYGVMVRDATSSESADWAIYLGWMPDMTGDYRTF